ncbi:MAG TPA: diguanylate cyclase [Novosphingobium sp.]|nr:diguanylate cyclase [Novosphingobium sp.]
MVPPRTLRRALVQGALYGAASAFSVELSRINDGFAMFWIADALLVSWLLALSPRRWWATLLTCAGATAAVTGLMGLGWWAALPLSIASTLEAVIGAGLIRAAFRRFRAFTALRSAIAAYVAGGIVAPLISAVPAALTMNIIAGRDFGSSFSAWALAHSLGFVGVFPCAGLLAQARARHRRVLPGPGQRKTAVLSLGAVVVAGGACFGQSTVPMLFLPILVVMYTMVLTDLIVTAVAMAMLMIMGVASAFLGIGPLRLVADAPAEAFLFLQFYTACISLAAMPIALLLERRRRVFAALTESEARYRLLADFSTDIIMVTEITGAIRYVSPSIRQLGDYEPAALVGTTTDNLIAPQHRKDVEAAHRGVVARPETTASVEFLGVTRMQGLRWFESHLRAVLREDGGVDGVCSIIRDISHRKRREAELNAVALTDPLTSLANRRAFELFMSAVGKDDGENYIALFDLDHFKRVNDSFGHEAGDRVLKAFARAARGVVRDCDLVARIGGEEFAIYLDATTLPQARLVCARICCALAEEGLRAAPRAGRITASVGLSRLDAPLATVMRRADAALYQAKADGRDRLAIAA